MALAAAAVLLWPAHALGSDVPFDSGRPELVTTLGYWHPFGQVLAEEFGGRYPFGIETRVRAASGLGGAVGAELWWRHAENQLSGMLPVTLEFNYWYPLLDGAVVPVGGVCARYTYTWISWESGDTTRTANGSGFGIGLSLGAEAPLGSRFKGVCRMRLIFGESRLAYSSDRNGMETGEHAVNNSSLDITFGVTSDLFDACLW